MTIDEFMRQFETVAKDFQVKKGTIQHKKTKCCPIVAVAEYTHSFMNSYPEYLGRKMGLRPEDVKAIIVATDGNAIDTPTRPKDQRRKMNTIRARLLEIMSATRGNRNLGQGENNANAHSRSLRDRLRENTRTIRNRSGRARRRGGNRT